MKSICALPALFCLSPCARAITAMSDAEIAKRLIQEPIGTYPANCPYNLARGYAPLCFEEDILLEMLKRYRLQTEAKQATQKKTDASGGQGTKP